ncbi:hypothetical protein JCM10207_007608 [Rhodosporidiobolus poonsookiae]
MLAARVGLKFAPVLRAPVVGRRFASSQTAKQSDWMKNWYDPAALPIFAIIGGDLTRLIRGPDVILDRHNNPTPWLNVGPRTQTKMMTITHDVPHDSPDDHDSLSSSALLQPFAHLLIRPRSPTEPLTPSSDSYERVEHASDSSDPNADGFVRPGAYSAGGSNAGSEIGTGFAGRRGSIVSSMLWSVGAGRKEGANAPPPPPLDLNPEEEERLADEWGLSQAMSAVESSAEGPTSPTSPGFDMAGVGLRHFPTATATSEAGLLNQERKLEALAEAAAEEDVELLETKSMPDLDRPRTVSFADSVLLGLDQRLMEKVAVNALVGSARSDVQPFTAQNDDEPSVPRIKIIERTATQRKAGRLRTQSLGTSLGIGTLPVLADITSAIDSSSNTSGGVGIASRDSLFAGPRARTASAIGSTANRMSAYSSRELSTAARSRRGSFDALSAVEEAGSRLSIAIPPSRPSTSAPRSPISPSSPTPPTPIEPSTAGFTSRFDPAVIAAQRAEVLKERPNFANPDAGRPPRVVLMPAPLAGRPPSPVRKKVVEGPNSSDEDEDEEDKEEEEEEEDDKPKRAAGQLYGRSLMDVIAERKAVQKGRQKAYNPVDEGRRPMTEWRDDSALSLSASASATQDALAQLEGRGGGAADGDDDVPLALVPAGGAEQRKQDLARIAKSKSTASVFGPDLIYQRELALAKEFEAEERAERERVEAIERAKAEKLRVKEEKRRSRGVLKKGDRRKSQGFAALETSREFRAREGVPSPQDSDYPQPSPVSLRQPAPVSPVRQHLHTLAPSISIPQGLGQLNTSTSGAGDDWFRPPSPPVKLTNDSDSDEEEELYKPRPISALGGFLAPPPGTQRRTSFGSDSSSEEEEAAPPVRPVELVETRRSSLPFPGEPSASHDTDLASPAALSPVSARPGHLPFPGEASSTGHGAESASLADTEDDRPLGVRYSRQSLMLQQVPVRADDSEDDEPLGKRYSRQSLLLPLDLPSVSAGENKLDLHFGGGEEEQEVRRVEEDQAAEDSDSSDDKPLGARFSRAPDDDDVPLAFRRMSLAPTALQGNAGFQPSATLHAIDDDGKTVQSEDSDDKPLGLKAAALTPQAGFGFPPPVHPIYPMAPAYPLAPALPYNQSQFFAPPAAYSTPMLPPAPTMDLAVAQMQMHAAMQQQQAFAAGGVQPGGMLGGGNGAAGIEAWRRSVM